eukprot:11243569-Ditylum_brightwellii.AAC.1
MFKVLLSTISNILCSSTIITIAYTIILTIDIAIVKIIVFITNKMLIVLTYICPTTINNL